MELDSEDRFDLHRFENAQAGVYAAVSRELAAGQKTSHWMWFIFPQLKGLGSSSMAQFYGIASRDEARAYRAHQVLGPRLVECTKLVLTVEGRSLVDILGAPDDLKFASSMTLFAAACSEDEIFNRALAKFCNNKLCSRTLAVLSRAN